MEFRRVLFRLAPLTRSSSEMVDRADMKVALAGEGGPAPRARGLTGGLPHLPRILPENTDPIPLPFHQHGGGFVIEIAQAPPGEFVSRLGTIPAARLTAHDLPQTARVQPGPDGSTDSWFRYDRRLSADQVSEQVLSCLDPMEAWWSGDKMQ